MLVLLLIINFMPFFRICVLHARDYIYLVTMTLMHIMLLSVYHKIQPIYKLTTNGEFSPVEYRFQYSKSDFNTDSPGKTLIIILFNVMIIL